MHQATELLVEKAKRLAAHLLEADVADIVVDTDAGTVGVAGVPAGALAWADLAAAVGRRTAPDVIGDGDLGPLAADTNFDQGDATFPFGAHIAVVEVDLDTGRSRVVRHVAVDDCGTVLNPLLVEGQQHGASRGHRPGALRGGPPRRRWQPPDLQPRRLRDPDRAELPNFEAHSTETPTPLNPLGAKGIGEAATIGSTPAVQNAVIDAVAHLGVRHLDMPARRSGSCGPRATPRRHSPRSVA